MRWTTVLTLCTLLLPATATAQGWIELLPRPIPQPQPPRVERLRTSVTVRVTDRVARVQVEEWFRNRRAERGRVLEAGRLRCVQLVARLAQAVGSEPPADDVADEA